MIIELLLQLGFSLAVENAKRHLNGSSTLTNYFIRFNVNNDHDFESLICSTPLEHTLFLIKEACGVATDLLPMQELAKMNALVNDSIITNFVKKESYQMNTDALLDIVMHYLSYADFLVQHSHLIRPFLANLALTMSNLDEFSNIFKMKNPLLRDEGDQRKKNKV